jgi:DNA modification methylase
MAKLLGKMAPSHGPETHIKDLTPDPANRRRHNPRNVGMLVDALQKVGASRSIVIDEDGLILAGNGVVEAASEAGITKLQVVEADGETLVAVRRRGLTPSQKRDLAIYDNRTAELAEWNVEQLAADLKNGQDLSAFFFEDELKTLLAEGAGVKAGQTDPDEVPAERPTGIVVGDLFGLGAHRLLCGDSTSGADVARLMAGSVADLVFTSPPYGQQRDYGAAISDWQALMLGVFSNLPAHESTQVLVNLGLIHRDGEWMPYWDGWIAWMREQGWRRFGWYVWDQGSGLPGDWNGRFGPSHEFVFHFNKVGVRPVKTMAKLETSEPMGSNLRSKKGANAAPSSVCLDPNKIPDSVIRVNRNSAHGTGHPATFPVALPLAVYECWPGIAFEPFAGSGSSLIAAEQLGRHCYGIEINPSYCQVIIDRWEAFTGQQAVKVGEAVRA